MQRPTPTYHSGEVVRIEDRIAYAGHPGRVVCVVESRSFSAGYPEDHWSYLGRGFLIDAEGFGLVHLPEADEDLILIGRA